MEDSSAELFSGSKGSSWILYLCRRGWSTFPVSGKRLSTGGVTMYSYRKLKKFWEVRAAPFPSADIVSEMRGEMHDCKRPKG